MAIITSVQCLGEDGLIIDWNPGLANFENDFYKYKYLGYDAGLPQIFTIHYENVNLKEEKGTLHTKETHSELQGSVQNSKGYLNKKKKKLNVYLPDFTLNSKKFCILESFISPKFIY